MSLRTSRAPAILMVATLLCVLQSTVASGGALRDEDYNLGTPYMMYKGTGIHASGVGFIALGISVGNDRVRFGPMMEFMTTPDIEWTGLHSGYSHYRPSPRMMESKTELSYSSPFVLYISLKASL